MSSGPEIDGLQYVERLGSGGYSDVLLYERRTPRMRVAVKILKDARLSDAERAQFAAEAEAMAELADHPYIVQVFSTGALDDGRPYLVMKYYPPPNLGARAERERMSVPDVLRTGIKIASAVETAHRAGILHRDIKPANILVSQYGEPGLTDFGIAGHAADAGADDDIGVSIPWAPPEVLGGGSNGSVQSDVYSLAATLWNLLAGRSPFEVPGGDNSPRALMARVLRTNPPATGRADVPASLERLLAQGMARNPATRPRTALDLARALQAVEQEHRFSRTEIVVDGLGAGARPAADPPAAAPGGEDQTRMRAPVRVDDAQGPSRFAPSLPKEAPAAAPPPAATARRSTPLAEPPTTARPAVVAGQPDARPAARVRDSVPHAEQPSTVRRPTAPEQEDETPVAPRRRGLRRTQAAFVAAAVVVAAIVLGVVLASGNSSGRHTGNTQPTGPDTTDLTQAIPPSTPTVTAKYDAHRRVLTFAWSAPGASGYSWFYTGHVDDPTPTKARSLALPKVAATDRICIQVQAIYRGSGASAPSDSVCGPQS